jgi:hypothetical protein
VSPTFLSHLVRVPSVIDSPIWGITTSVGIAFLPVWRGFRAVAAKAFPMDYKTLRACFARNSIRCSRPREA